MNLIDKIYNLKLQKEQNEQKMKELKEINDSLEIEINSLSVELLNSLKSENKKEEKFENLVATIFEKESITYVDENKILDYLKQNCEGKYIKTTIKEALDKNNLKKAMKNDETLSNGLSELIKKENYEYVVVTTEENHTKMLEHIEKNK